MHNVRRTADYSMLSYVVATGRPQGESSDFAGLACGADINSSSAKLKDSKPPAVVWNSTSTTSMSSNFFVFPIAKAAIAGNVWKLTQANV